METQLLIIFAKNPVQGKVKTRLAADVGHEKALDIYNLLLAHTISITDTVTADKTIYFSDFIPNENQTHYSRFSVKLQKGVDLGQRLLNAFENSFAAGYHSVIIIGSDCYELTHQILKQAFEELNTKDVVIGPAMDGGYYLIGSKTLQTNLFNNKEWSTSTVFEDTKNDLDNLNLAYSILEPLNDIDTKEDLLKSSILY